MPFQPGNQEAKKAALNKPWKEAIARAIKRREEKDPLALEKLADKLMVKAGEGDIGALKELGDRIDGKVPQAVIGGDEDTPAIKTVTRIELVGVRPSDQDS